jgi:uroporphyrinogen-III decarboxylase
VDDFDWSIVAQKASEVDRDEYYIRGFMEMGLFERSYLLLGMEEALISYITEPERMSELLGALADARIAELQRFDDVCDLDMLWYGDDWGTQTNLFLPAGTWRQVIKPHTQRIYDAMKQRGILIWQHSCGKIDKIFGDMVEMGAQVWDPCQPCNDLAELKRQYGQRITFCGGIDSQAVLDKPGVTTDEVRAEVRLRIDQMAHDGGYLAGPIHCVPYDVDLLNAMNTEIETYGRSVYAG